MDIQSVIVSVKELENTKNSITEAIKSKGVTSQGRFSTFESEIRSIPTSTGGSNEDYQKLVRNIKTENVFKLANDKLVSTGSINNLIEDIKTNSVKIYSLQDITNVRLKSDTYKSRINHIITKESKQLSLGLLYYGVVEFNVLSIDITPIEAEVTTGETTITYSCGGEDKTVNMPIQDREISKEDTSIFWVSHRVFNPYNDRDKDLRFTVSISNAEEDYPAFISGNALIKKFNTRPAIFTKLDNLNGSDTVNAMLVFSNNGANVEYIPVKLSSMGMSNMNIQLGSGYNSCTIELRINKLLFHFSNNTGSLDKQLVISRAGLSTTESDISSKAKSLYTKEYGMVGIAMKADGSPITQAEVEGAGFRI